MTDVGQTLGVQSFCFRNSETPEDVAARVKECGLSTIELCALHWDLAAPETFDGVLKVYSAAGVEVCSIGPHVFKGDEAIDRNCFELVKRAGLSVMACNFDISKTPEVLDSSQKLADEYGVNLAIHNHGGRHWLGSVQVLENTFANTGPRIGLCLDTAWAMHSHEDPIAMVEQFGDRLYGLHVKDFTFDRSGMHEDVVVGTGNLDLTALAAALKAVDFQGYAVLEYEADPDNPVPALTACVDAVRSVDWT